MKIKQNFKDLWNTGTYYYNDITTNNIYLQSLQHCMSDELQKSSL